MLKINYDKCTGCGACKAACPLDCISMQESKDGFIYPNINISKCVDCHKCEIACPIEHRCELEYDSEAYGAVYVDHKTLMNSTSGGAFSAIAEYVFSKNGVVYGCAYSKHLKPIHIRINKWDQLHLLNGSKYIQSDTLNTFQTAKEDLEAGTLVLYSGTPCQIAGLKSFLRKEYKNLITVDIICHGVPSYAYFKKYIDWLEITRNIQLKTVNFRSKENNQWGLSGNFIAKDMTHNRIIKMNLFYYNSYYYYYFLKGGIYRNSCYSCKYANMQRQGDFTLGDLWGAEGLGLPFDVRNGCSLVLVNSIQAKMILKRLKLKKASISVEYAITNNTQLKSPSIRPNYRDILIEQYQSLSANEINQYFHKRFWKDIIIGRGKSLIPIGLKNNLLKLIYKRKSNRI